MAVTFHHYVCTTHHSKNTFVVAAPHKPSRFHLHHAVSYFHQNAHWAYIYDELIARDKVSLDIFWLRDESLEDAANLPAPDILASEIADDLQAALDEFLSVSRALAA